MTNAIVINAAKINAVRTLTGCTAEDAREYLAAEEGDVLDAVASFRGDAAERQAAPDDVIRAQAGRIAALEAALRDVERITLANTGNKGDAVYVIARVALRGEA